MEYENLLDKAYKKMQQVKVTEERFKIPIPELMIQGNQTIVKNFAQICEALRREPFHVLKFLAKELASPAGLDQTRATFQTKISQKIFQQKLEIYIKEYVYCRECHRPDTKLVKEDRITFLVCEACGAKSSVKSIK